MSVLPHALCLPERWRGRERFVVLDHGFGFGHAFLATWDAWCNDPERCGHLHCIVIDRDLPTQAVLAAVHAASSQPARSSELVAAWPPMTQDLHPLSFERGRVQLLLVPGDLAEALPDLVARVDAFQLGSAAASFELATWEPRRFKALARVAAPLATVVLRDASPSLQNALTSAGFVVAETEHGAITARFAPAFTPRSVPHRQAARAASESRRALIVGAGLAGCAAAWALAEQGWHSQLIDAHDGIASEASGNPGGLFHGIVNAQDGLHARFNRAAALAAAEAVRVAVNHHGVAGNANGLLRLETGLSVHGMAAVLEQLGLPADYVQAASAARASALGGLPLMHPAWFYPGGGWVQPAGLARSFLERAGTRCSFMGRRKVHTLRRVGTTTELLDAEGHCVAAAETVVLANAGDALWLLGQPDWPIVPVRGQLSMRTVAASGASSASPPTLPIAGAGYVLPEVSGSWVFGATAHAGDHDAGARLADHVANLAQLSRIVPEAKEWNADDLQARVAWRWVAGDRLPVIGAVPDTQLVESAAGTDRRRLDQPRFVPRLPGLFVFTALASRGITWSALGAQVLASCISGAPQPVEASLRDAVDPARFITRRLRRSAASEGSAGSADR